MLLRFSVSNYGSICDEQSISLVASSLNDAREGLIQCPSISENGVVPIAAVYGANASGKTNLLKAFRFMRSSALFSHSRGDPGETI